MEDLEKIAKDVVHCAYQIHKQLGPGLLEKYMKYVLNLSWKTMAMMWKDKQKFLSITKELNLGKAYA